MSTKQAQVTAAPNEAVAPAMKPLEGIAGQQTAAPISAAEKAEKEAADKEAARKLAIANAPKFKLAGNEVNTLLLENAVKRVISDAGRMRADAESLNLGSEVKTITGTAVRVVNITAARELARRGVLGDKPKTKQRLDDLIQMNNLIDAMQHFGLLRRQIDK